MTKPLTTSVGGSLTFDIARAADAALLRFLLQDVLEDLTKRVNHPSLGRSFGAFTTPAVGENHFSGNQAACAHPRITLPKGFGKLPQYDEQITIME